MDGDLANAGDVEGVDRKSTTVTEKPAAAAKNLSKKRKGFFILNQISTGFEPLPPANYQLPPTNYHLKLTTHNLTSANYHLKPTTNNLTPKIYHLQPITYNPQPANYHLSPRT